jgi:hypothetical protein
LKISALALGVAVAALAAASVSASPIGDTRIRHGAGVGRVQLGMTYGQLRKALGGPQVVQGRQTLRGGLRYVEFDWDFGWWKVALAGRPGRLRVAFIQTQSRGERTLDGLGVGTWESVLRRELRPLRCQRVRRPFRGATLLVTVESRCTYASHRGRETAFVLEAPPGPEWSWKRRERSVTSVRVHETRVDYCSRPRHVCEPLRPL